MCPLLGIIASSDSQRAWYLYAPRQGTTGRLGTARVNTLMPEVLARNSQQVESEKYRRKLQRILKTGDMANPGLSGGVAPFERGRMSEQKKSAYLAPSLVNPPSTEDEGPLFQCTQCDMIVKESDPYCPFCGAIFADAASQAQPKEQPAERPERASPREPFVRPDKFDIFSMMKTRARSKDLLYHEALKGFTGSARLLEEIEHLVSDVGTLGTDTSKARRMIGSAWEACRDGDWHLVTTLAKQTEDLVSPSIPDLVRREIAQAREYLQAAKSNGKDISAYVLKIKSAMQALHSNDPDEALRITKELLDSLREDSIAWK